MPGGSADQRATFCPLCVSRCGATATVVDGRLTAIGPDGAPYFRTRVHVTKKALDPGLLANDLGRCPPGIV